MQQVKKLGTIVVAVLVMVILVMATGQAPARADSCSARAAICNNVCYHRSGDSAKRCFRYCKDEKRACLHTGVFRTTGGNYSGLDRR
ncbi:MAG: hypothetical protein GC182_09365 [Rhodopseudomonas sp.]|nr:hypothetical protein [Rhodopseudomonas sp.]